MNEHNGAPDAGNNIPVYSVSELSQALKRAVEEGFGWVRVRGEISGFKRAGSGHLYFSLKDADALLDAVCWRGTAGRLGLAPEDGMEVIASGKLTTYPNRSRYQIVVQSLELAGEGALLKLLEERKKKLAAEGLFEPERKAPIPYLPEVIGVVTSPTGAVIRDILHRVADRFPRRVLLWPVLVQGEGAAAQVAAAIEGFNRLAAGGPVPRPDVLIVARGGGSLEDLWAFNEEIVVRAAAASAIPLIAAIGHETDVTLIDLAADRRAPTPSAAAEMAVPVRAELLEALLGHERRLVGGLARLLAERRGRLEGLARGLPDAPSLLGTAAQRLDDWSERLGNALRGRLRERRDHVAKLRPPHPRQLLKLRRTELTALERALTKAWVERYRHTDDGLRALGKLLESYSYKGVLARGYTVVRDAAMRPLLSARAVESGAALAIEFHDGAVGARATGVLDPSKVSSKEAPAKRGAGKRPKGGSSDGGRQGSLL